MHRILSAQRRYLKSVIIPTNLQRSTQWSNKVCVCSPILSARLYYSCDPQMRFQQINNKKQWNNINYFYKDYSMSSGNLQKSSKPSSKVEETVNKIKEELEEKEKGVAVPEVRKKTIKQKILDEINHYYHGFRLLGKEVKISCGLAFRVLRGANLSRREHRLLVKTIGDLFRLVPLLVFLVVPFLELALPIFLKFFPGMLPSTFETKDQKDQKFRQHLKVRLEMAKFFQATLDEMAPQAKDRHSAMAKDFASFFKKVRSADEILSSDEIMKFAKLFEDEITLDSLHRPHLVALCKVLNVSSIGTEPMLRFNLRMKLRSLAADDKMIAKEGVDSLTLSELQTACQARGMRAYGMAEDRLRKELNHWLDLSLNKKVPPTLLLLSKTLIIRDLTATDSDKLKATISTLPEDLVTKTKAAIGEKEGKVDFKAKLEALKLEEKQIKEERKEQQLLEAQQKKKEEQEAQTQAEKEALEKESKVQDEKEVLKDTAKVLDPVETPELKDKAPSTTKEEPVPVSQPAQAKEQGLSAKDLEVIEQALDNIAKMKKTLLIERETIQELKAEMSDYSQDVEELQAIAKDKNTNVKVSKGAARLYKTLNGMIEKMDKKLAELEEKEKKLRSTLEQQDPNLEADAQLVHIDELMTSIKSLYKVTDEGKLKLIQDILARLDADFDGKLKVDDILKIVEIISNENVHLSEKQIGEIIDLLNKEEALEIEHRAQSKPQNEQERAEQNLLVLLRQAQERTRADNEKKRPDGS